MHHDGAQRCPLCTEAGPASTHEPPSCQRLSTSPAGGLAGISQRIPAPGSGRGEGQRRCQGGIPTPGAHHFPGLEGIGQPQSSPQPPASGKLYSAVHRSQTVALVGTAPDGSSPSSQFLLGPALLPVYLGGAVALLCPGPVGGSAASVRNQICPDPYSILFLSHQLGCPAGPV